MLKPPSPGPFRCRQELFEFRRRQDKAERRGDLLMVVDGHAASRISGRQGLAVLNGPTASSAGCDSSGRGRRWPTWQNGGGAGRGEAGISPEPAWADSGVGLIERLPTARSSSGSAQASVPPQELPRPAVHPKQWRRNAIGRGPIMPKSSMLQRSSPPGRGVSVI